MDKSQEKTFIKGRVLFAGQSFYHAWYLSRELRKLGWKADVLNFDPNIKNHKFYHGEDYLFTYNGLFDRLRQYLFYIKSLKKYDIFHFSNAYGLQFGPYLSNDFKLLFGEYSDIKILKKLGKKIVYSNVGCLDGVSQSSFSKWGPANVCDICQWKNQPMVCCDTKNLNWGRIRNELADYQVTTGANRVDYNDDPRVHEIPQFYCLDHTIWKPDLLIPTNYMLPFPENTIKIYHAVGNFESRSDSNNTNIKCTHIFIPVVEKLKSEGYPVELIFFKDVPNIILRYYQAQADIFVDMLTYGWFGANIREGMMLGKPCVCFLRPEWLEYVKKEIPNYIEELPVISATPDTIYTVLKELADNPEKRKNIGKQSREFAVKWHSAEAAAKKFDEIYTSLLLKHND